jgi:hypothetical protein
MATRHTNLPQTQRLHLGHRTQCFFSGCPGVGRASGQNRGGTASMQDHPLVAKGSQMYVAITSPRTGSNSTIQMHGPHKKRESAVLPHLQTSRTHEGSGRAESSSSSSSLLAATNAPPPPAVGATAVTTAKGGGATNGRGDSALSRPKSCSTECSRGGWQSERMGVGVELATTRRHRGRSTTNRRGRGDHHGRSDDCLRELVGTPQTQKTRKANYHAHILLRLGALSLGFLDFFPLILVVSRRHSSVQTWGFRRRRHR